MSTSPEFEKQMQLLLVIWLIFVFGPTCSTCHTHSIHKLLSPSDLMSIFNVQSHHEVPEYDVTTVRIVAKRSIDQDDHRRVNLRAFGENVQLSLKPNVEFNKQLETLKLFTAQTDAENEIIYSEEHTNGPVGLSYHDDTKMAAVVIRQGPNGDILMDGTIGDELVIKPLPSSMTLSRRKADGDYNVTNVLQEDPNSSVNISSSNSSSVDQINEIIRREQAHFVFKKAIYSNVSLHSDFAQLEPGKESSFENSTWNLFKSSNSSNEHLFNSGNKRFRRNTSNGRESHYTAWPEVLLIVDYDSFLLHNANNEDVKRYFISFWNGVDLRYKLLSHPRIRVCLIGIIVAKDAKATPYLERNRLKQPNDEVLDVSLALNDVGRYLYRESRLPHYDLVVVITKLDLCRRSQPGAHCSRATAGFAYIGGACVINKRLQKVNSAALVEDSGGFSGIIVAAHEIGHLLGCVHDGSPAPSYLGGPGATKCPWEDGFIMSDHRYNELGFRWSTCSVDQFEHFLNGRTASCLFNYPHEPQLMTHVLPGAILTLDQQCQRDRGANACFKDARVCSQLFCYDKTSGYCISFRTAAEGSYCGDGMICRDGKCISEVENFPPLNHTQIVPNSAVTRSTNDLDSDQISCSDTNEHFSGFSCSDFLKLYGYRYCDYSYIKKNCCSSYEVFCNNKI